MLLISICTALMVFGFVYAEYTTQSVELDNGERRRLITQLSAFYLAAVLIIVSTLRYGFIDTFAYKYMYRAVRGNYSMIFTGVGWGIEPGWLFVNYVLNFFSKSPKLILFLSALVINLAYMKSARRYSSDPVLSFFLFFCLMYMDTNNGVRQMVAAAIVILAFPLFEKRRYFLFALFVALAYQLHNTAVVWVLIAIAVVGEPMNIRTKFALLLGLVFLFSPGLVTGFLDSVTADNQYNSYLDLKGGMRIARALVSGVIPGALSIIYYYKSKRKGVVLDRSDSMMLNIVIINTMFVLMGTYMQYWNRFAFYTMFSTYIMIPKLAEGVFGEYSFYRGGVRTGMIILYFLYFCYNVYANSGLPGASSDSLHNFYIEWWC